jgi:hypothetical protein
MSVTLVRVSSTEWRWRYDIPWGCGEFQVIDVAPIAADGPILGLNGAWAVENGIYTMLVDPKWQAVWEYATAIGRAGAPLSTFDYFGGGHGHQKIKFGTISVDGIDAGSAPIGGSAAGGTIVMQQQMEILLPADRTVVCGMVSLTHTLCSTGMNVRSEYIIGPGAPFEWFDSRTAMLPVGIFDCVQFANHPVETVLAPKHYVVRDLGSHATLFQASSTTHPYTLAMSLPSGGPNTAASWARSEPTCAFWLDQDYPKIYVNEVSVFYSDRVAAFSTSHVTNYTISKAV